MNATRRQVVTSNLSDFVAVNTMAELNARSAAADRAIWELNKGQTGYLGDVAKNAKFRADHYDATGEYLRGAKAS